MYQALILSMVFFTLSLLHFYWASGGQWWLDQALPMNEQGDHVLKPSKLPTIIVGIGLLGFGAFYVAVLLGSNVSGMMSIVGWIIPSIFLLRAIGDFRYVGFFKRIRQTDFAKYDTRIYAPLCLTIALIAFMTANKL